VEKSPPEKALLQQKINITNLTRLNLCTCTFSWLALVLYSCSSPTPSSLWIVARIIGSLEVLDKLELLIFPGVQSGVFVGLLLQRDGR
jgi:hypothetical protein